MLEMVIVDPCSCTDLRPSASPVAPTELAIATEAMKTMIEPKAANAVGRAQRCSQASSAPLPASISSAPLVEVELGEGALDDLRGHPLGDLEVAGAHRDV